MLVLGSLLGSFTSPLLAEHQLTELFLGEETFPSIRIWNFVDRVVNAGLFVPRTAGPDKDTPTLIVYARARRDFGRPLSIECQHSDGRRSARRRLLFVC